jgi:hypothetical protein
MAASFQTQMMVLWLLHPSHKEVAVVVVVVVLESWRLYSIAHSCVGVYLSRLVESIQPPRSA